MESITKLTLLLSIYLTIIIWTDGFNPTTRPSNRIGNRILSNSNIASSIFVNPTTKRKLYSSLFPQEIVAKNSEEEEVQFKVVTFNILAPCYKRLPGSSPEIDKASKIFESSDEGAYIERNNAICDLLLDSDADIVCLQEFWSGSATLVQLYKNRLCEGEFGKYSMHFLERTSQWNARKDGLAMFVRRDRFVVEDEREILFHDCGDRVALMLLLSMIPSSDKPDSPPQRLICVNTHLLFPHNLYSSKIRLREATKLLGFIEAYKQRELCESVCGRGDVRLPVLVAGDFNGSPRGAVYGYMKSQNFRSALEEECLQQWDVDQEDNRRRYSGDSGIDNDVYDWTVEEALDDAPRSRWENWVSHRSHRGESVAVDHIFYLNPSQQTVDRLPPLPDWTNLVYYELMQRIIAEYGASNMKEAFESFDTDNSSFITREEFETALGKLGFLGENTAALTKKEIDMLVRSADKDDDGFIDYKEFCDRFQLADDMVQQWQNPSKTTNTSNSKNMGIMLNSRRFAFARSKWLANNALQEAREAAEKSDSLESKDSSKLLPNAVPMGDLRVQRVGLYPSALENGMWPEQYKLSDHGMVECIFSGKLNPSRDQNETKPFVLQKNINDSTPLTI